MPAQSGPHWRRDRRRGWPRRLTRSLWRAPASKRQHNRQRAITLVLALALTLLCNQIDPWR